LGHTSTAQQVNTLLLALVSISNVPTCLQILPFLLSRTPGCAQVALVIALALDSIMFSWSAQPAECLFVRVNVQDLKHRLYLCMLAERNVKA